MKVHQLQNKLKSPLFLMKAAFANMWRMPKELLLAKQAERRRRHDIDAIRFSGLFDDEWYLAQNPDVALQQLEPIRHYVEHGAHEGRDPSRYFDTLGYLEKNPDVAAARINPFVHYIKYGRHENRGPQTDRYQLWCLLFDTLTDADRDVIRNAIRHLAVRPVISILMPVYNTDRRFLERAISSVRAQLYPHWELCISDDASSNPVTRKVIEQFAKSDKRIRVFYRDHNGHISANSNCALSMASGEFVALMDDDDELPEHALFWVAHEIADHPEVDLIFTDEDKIDEHGVRFSPYFKSDWNPALILSQNCFSHLGVYRRSLVERVGGFRTGFEGSQDHDLVLRCSELTSPERIRHIPRVLYHWRARSGSTAVSGAEKPYAWQAGARAIQEHLQRQSVEAKVEPALSGCYRVEYQPNHLPPVSIVIPSTCKLPLLEQCVTRLLRHTDYPQFEVLLVASRPDLSQAEAFLRDSWLMRTPPFAGL